MYKVKFDQSTVMKQGDTKQEFTAQIQDGGGSPVNLTGATVRLLMADRAVVLDKPVFVTSPTTGNVKFSFATEDMTGFGNLKAEFKIIFSGSPAKEAKAPTNGYIQFRVHQQLSDLGNETITPSLYTQVIETQSNMQSQIQEIYDNGVDPAVKTQVEEQGSKIDVLSYKNENKVAIKQFDGSPLSSDNKQAILDAFSALPNGGIIYIPEGEYVTSPFSIPPNIMIEGAGQYLTVLKNKNGSNADFITFDQARASGIYNLSIEGNKNNNLVGSGIVIKNSQQAGKDNSRNLKIEHIQIRNFAEDGIKVLFPYVWVFMLRFIKIDGCKGYGVYNNATDNSFYMIDIYGCEKGAVKDEGKNNRWMGGKWYVNGDKTGQTSSSSLHTSAKRTSYTGIELQDNHGHGINIVNGEDLMFSGVWSDSSGILTDVPVQKTGIQLQNSKRVSFAACNVCNYLSETTQYRGVYIDGTCQDIDLGIKIASSNITVPLEINNSAKNINNFTNIRKDHFVRVYLDTLQTIPAATFTKINFNVVLNDDWSAYNTSSKTFYAKTDGIYMVSAFVQWSQQTDGNRTRLALYKNSSNFAFLDDNTIGGSSYSASSGSVPVKLLAGEFIEIYAYSQNQLNTGVGASSVYLDIVKIA